MFKKVFIENQQKSVWRRLFFGKGLVEKRGSIIDWH